ncbi:MAG: hypothetical protein P8Y07_10180 [Gemmatimonadales bacterium]
MRQRLMASPAVPDVGVDAEDALNVHRALECRLDGIQLDLAILGDRGDAGRQAGSQAGQHELDGRGPMVLGREDLRVVGVEREGGPVLLLLAESEESLDRGAAVRAVHPLAGRPPRELGRFRHVGQSLAGLEQRGDVYAVVDGTGHNSHDVSFVRV